MLVAATDFTPEWWIIVIIHEQCLCTVRLQTGSWLVQGDRLSAAPSTQPVMLLFNSAMNVSTSFAFSRHVPRPTRKTLRDSNQILVVLLQDPLGVQSGNLVAGAVDLTSKTPRTDGRGHLTSMRALGVGDRKRAVSERVSGAIEKGQLVSGKPQMISGHRGLVVRVSTRSY
jgi:hypothetical protein